MASTLVGMLDTLVARPLIDPFRLFILSVAGPIPTKNLLVSVLMMPPFSEDRSLKPLHYIVATESAKLKLNTIPAVAQPTIVSRKIKASDGQRNLLHTPV